MKIFFNINYNTEWGQQVYVIGSHTELGLWDIGKARLLEYSTGGLWQGKIDFLDEEELNFEYRYIIKHDNGTILREGGNNRKFLLYQGSTSKIKDIQIIEFQDKWRECLDTDTVFLTSAFSEVIFRRNKICKTSSTNSKIISGDIKTILHLQLSTNRIGPEHILCVTGSLPFLGDWDIIKSVKMDSSQFPLWTLDIPLKDNDVPFSYSYVIKDGSNNVVLTEEGEERMYEGIKELPYKDENERKIIIFTDDKFSYPKKWKGAGVSVPVFSLRSDNSLGGGEFLDIKLLIDWAGQCGLQLIQILPVNDTTEFMNWLDGYPYSITSVFSLHPQYINLEAIGGLSQKIIKEIQVQKKILNAPNYFDYEKVITFKKRILHEIYLLNKNKFLSSPGFQKFMDENAYWLKPYAAFYCLRDKYGTSDFIKWDTYTKPNEEDIQFISSKEFGSFDKIAEIYFIQYHLHLQLLEASNYAKRKNIILKGDVPIGINKRGPECWMNQDMFNLDQTAGAPPDPFSVTGQNWNFPTYNWDVLERDNYSWWKARLKKMSSYFQMVRLDHVLGFFRIWEIPEYSVSGLMGHFNPAIPLWREELERQGIWDFNRLCDPFIPSWLVKIIFGEDADEVVNKYMEEYIQGCLRLKSEYNTQRRIEELFSSQENASKPERPKNEKIKIGLFNLLSNIVLFRDKNRDGFHFRINMMDTISFKSLENWVKEKLRDYYNDYFYRRQNDFWRRQGIKKLPVLKQASNMLVCGEDLGMIPDCVPLVMEELCILALRIQRMPKEAGREFGYTEIYPYLSVCSTGSHDMSTIRGWWEEDRGMAQRYYNNVLRHAGIAPQICDPRICQEIVNQHLESSSMWVIFPIQDILNMSAELRRPGDTREEQINDPSNPRHQWKFRLHINLEKLIEQKEFNGKLRKMVHKADRLSVY